MATLCFWVGVSLMGACKKAPILASLSSLEGDVQRDLAAAPRRWSSANAGDTFVMGDGIKTGPKSHAQLRLGDGTALKLRPEAVLRFATAADTEKSFDLEVGEVLLELGAAPMRLRSAVGLAVLEGGTQIVLRQEGRRTRIEVVVGMANFTPDKGEAIEIKAGQRILVDVDTAQIERMEPVAVAPASQPAQQVATKPVAVAVEGAIDAQIVGRRIRYKQDDQSPWEFLAPGARTLGAGSSIDVPASTSVRLQQGEQSATVHGAGQFLIGKGVSLVETKQGRVSFERPAGDTMVSVPGGTISVRATSEGTVAELLVNRDRSVLLKVQNGLAAAETRFGSDEISAGEQLVLSPEGRINVTGRGPEVADLSLKAGDSCVVHDPSPPTAVEVDFASACPQGGRLRVGARRVVLPKRGSAVIVALNAGSHRYTVLCGNASAGQGSIEIVRDPGTSRLPRVPPASMVDTDGRNYTILYQNLLPEVHVRWPAAPKASRYQLEWVGNGSTKTITTDKPKHVFKPAALSEGTHRLTFATYNDSTEVRRSIETNLKIRFDNAAPAAVVHDPSNRAFKLGDTVDVAGIALPGWQVSSMGADLKLDPQHRFSGQVRADPNRRALAIRFQHQDRGVHYYLRRPAGNM